MDRHAASLLLLALIASGCGSTPGDAAVRGGHPDAAARLYEQGAAQGDGTAALKLGLLVAEHRVKGYGVAGDWFVKSCNLSKTSDVTTQGLATSMRSTAFR